MIEIDFRAAPVHKTTLSLAPRAADYVIVNGDAQPGLYLYRAEVRPARAVARQARPKRAKTRPILVKGGSPPTVIIDT